MTARIFKPARTAMQAGTAKTRMWTLEFEPEQARVVEPLMGWTSTMDMKQQVRLRFESLDEAVAYCTKRGIAYQISEPNTMQRRTMAYADNFASTRREGWTH